VAEVFIGHQPVLERLFVTADLSAIVDEFDPEANMVIDPDDPNLPPALVELVSDYREQVCHGDRLPVMRNCERRSLIGPPAPKEPTPPKVLRKPPTRKKASRGRKQHTTGSASLGSNWLAATNARDTTRQTRLHREQMTDAALLRRHYDNGGP
jgi:hypothetical protein